MPQYEISISFTHRMGIILDAKYKKDDINKFMKKQCQQLSSREIESLLNPLKALKIFSMEL